mgnify:CR=1 FL=1
MACVAALPLLLGVAGCSKEYDDSELRSKISSLESRIAQLESLQNAVSGLQTTVSNLQKNISVTGVKTDTDGNLSISFSDGSTATLSSGKVVSVKEVDGVLYWAIDGELVKDLSGNPVPINGEESIQFRVNADGTLEYSADKGGTWTAVKGEPAEPGIEVTETDDAYTVVFADGSTFVLPKQLPFTLKIQEPSSWQIAVGNSLNLSYTITGVAPDEKTDLGVIGAPEGIEVVITAASNAAGTIGITNKSMDGGAFTLVLYATNHAGLSDICSLDLSAGEPATPDDPGTTGYSAFLGNWTSTAGTLTLAAYPEVENVYLFTYSGFGSTEIPAIYSEADNTLCFGTMELATDGNWTYFFAAIDSDGYIELGGEDGEEVLAYAKQAKDGVLTIVGNEYDAVYSGKTYHEKIVSLSIFAYLSKDEGTQKQGWYSFSDITPLDLPASFTVSESAQGAPRRMNAAALPSSRPVPAKIRVK